MDVLLFVWPIICWRISRMIPGFVESCFPVNMFSFLWYQCLEMQLMFTLKKKKNCQTAFQSGYTILHSHRQCMIWFLHNFASIWFHYFFSSHCGMSWYCISILICNSFTANNFYYLFMYLFDGYGSFLVKCLFMYFSKFFSLILSTLCILYMSWIYSLLIYSPTL